MERNILDSRFCVSRDVFLEPPLKSGRICFVE